MHVSGPPTAPPPSLPVPATLRHYRVGDRMEAVALTSSRGHTALLAVQGVPLRTRIDRPVTEGQHLRLEVVRPGDPLTVRVLEAGAADAALAVAARRLLPAQGGWGHLLANLAWLMRPAGQATLAALPAPAQTALHRLWHTLPDAARLSRAETLHQALQNGGHLLEQRLVTASGDPGNDLKAALLRLRDALRTGDGAPGRTAGRGEPPLPEAGRPLPQARVVPSLAGLADNQAASELARQSDAVLARLGLHQLLAVVVGGTGIPLLELPVRHDEGADLLHLAIEPETEDAGDGSERAWWVTLALDLPELGPLQIRCRLQGERLDATFWADRTATQNRVTEQLGSLRARLADANLRPGRLDCQPGPPPAGAGPGQPYSGLIHEQI